MLLPLHFWWFIGFFLVPLFYLAIRLQLTWLHGLCWGILFTILAGGGEIYCVLYPLAIHPLAKIIMGISFIIYIGLHSAVLFGIGQFIFLYRKKYTPVAHPLFICTVWTTIFWLFFVWMSGYSLWIFIRCEGPSYFTNPITALIQYPPLLQGITWFGKYGLLGLLIAWQGLLTLVLLIPHLRYITLWIGLSALWLFFVLQARTVSAPAWIARIAHIPRSLTQELSHTHTAKLIRTYLETIAQHDPEIDIFIIPEDGIQSCQFCSNPALCKTCMPCALDKQQHFIFGAYRKNKNQEFNTLYYLANGELKQYYDKQHTMIFTEEIPALFGTNIFKNYIQACSFSHGHRSRNPLEISPNLAFIPYICSEIFFLDQPDDAHPELPILALCSDKWAFFTYSKERALRVAQLKALEWQRDVLFISYHVAGLLTKTGQYFLLKDFSSILKHADKHNRQMNLTHNALRNLDFKTYTSINNYNAYAIGHVTDSHQFSLLLNNLHPYFGFSFSFQNHINNIPEYVRIVVKQTLEQADKKIHVYMTTGPDEIYYIDTMKVPANTKHLTITISSGGVVIFDDPLHEQTIIMSKYR